MVMQRPTFIESYFDPPDNWRNWEFGLGPGLLLLSIGWSLVANAWFGKNIGTVGRVYRIPWSPGRRAFGIWGLIYAWSFASVVFQLLFNLNDDIFYCAPFRVNGLVASAWVLAGLWVVLFSPERLRIAAIVLVAAAGCMLTAVILDRGWWPDDDEAGGKVAAARVLTVTVPNGLLGGWLLVAASLNLAYVVEAMVSQKPVAGVSTVTREQCRAMRYQQSIDDDEYNNANNNAAFKISWSNVKIWGPPAALSSVATTLAIALPDPLLALPAAWGIAWIRRPNTVTGSCVTVLMTASIIAVIRIATR